jgi:hypothetical protein
LVNPASSAPSSSVSSFAGFPKSSAYLETVASLLAGHEIGDGIVARAVAEAQRRYYDPPMAHAPGLVSKYR